MSNNHLKFDTKSGTKQRIAHRGVSGSVSLLKDLEHKKQSITQVLTSSPKKNISSIRSKQGTLTSFLTTKKPLKRPKLVDSYMSDDSDGNDLNTNSRSTNESTSSFSGDEDDLAIGGTSTDWMNKARNALPKKEKSKNSHSISLPKSQPRPSASSIEEIKLPPPPPLDFIVKRAVVISSDEEEDSIGGGKMGFGRKAILMSDDENDSTPVQNHSTATETEWLSTSKHSKKHDSSMERHKNEKSKPKKTTLKALKLKTKKLKGKKHKAFGVDEEEFSENDSDEGGPDVRQDSLDSDDSEAGEHLSAKQQKKLRELEQKCVNFINNASLEELNACEKFNDRFTVFVMEKRPFANFVDLKEKTAEAGTSGGKRGVGAIMSRQLEAYLDWLENRGILDQVLDECREQSKLIAKALEEAKDQKPVERPAGLNPKCSLHPYQQIGLNWLIMMNKLGLNAILADEMGLGKTIQVIAFLAWAKDQQGKQPRLKGPHLIIVPSSTIENWMQEIAQWAPDLRVLTYYGSIEDRQHLRNSARKHEVDLVLTTYNMVISRQEDRKFFKRFSMNYVIYDEGHMLRNCATQRYNNLMRIHGKRKILLTGTPLQNNLVELVSLIYFTMRQLFDKYCDNISSLLQMFAIRGKALMQHDGKEKKLKRKGIVKNSKESIEENELNMDIGDGDMDTKVECEGGGIANSLYEKHKIAQAKSILQPFILRRLKIEVLSCLPKKQEYIEFCEPTTLQANLYAGILDDLQARKEMASGSGGNGSGLDLLMQMRKVANHPLLYRLNYDDQKVVEMAKHLCLKEKFYEKKRPDYLAEDLAYESDIALHLLCQKFKRAIGGFVLDKRLAIESGKVKALDRHLPEIIKEKGEKVLIFSQFTSMLDILELYLNYRGYNFLRLDGSTPVLERQEMINLFNDDPRISVFLLSTRAGGLGINLTAANHIIIHDIDFNPYNDKQAEDRCHRMGQKKDVRVIRLICKGTIEEQMLMLVQQKLELERDVTSSEGLTHDEGGGKINRKTVEELLRNALGGRERGDNK